MIADRYEPIEQIGTGGMATVWRAKDTLLGRFVAIKRLAPHLADDPVAAQRFNREAQAAAGLSHPGIVTVFDTGEDDEGPFIVLELIEGPTLADRLAETRPLDPATVVDIVSQVASALDHAHAQGVVHRDIKPANVILEPGGRARLADFGIARTIEDPATITDSGELVGTITYLAPEILSGQPATPLSDVYSLGAVSYELLAGRPPYQAETPAALLDAVRRGVPPTLHGMAPDQMVSAVSSAMARDPAARPATAGELAAAMVGSATLVMGPGMVSTSPGGVALGSEDPTVVSDLPLTPVRQAERTPTRRVRWSLAAGLLALLALAATAMTMERDPGAAEEGAGLAAATTTVTSNTTTLPTTTTTAPTTTTAVPTTTTGVDTPEGVAEEIFGLLAALRPPEFQPKEIRRVEDRLGQVMEAWQDDDREELRRELERTFEAVADLEPSEQQDQLSTRLVELAELMGFDVEQGDGGDGGD
jgi:serine/threonine-protein kinase